MIYEGFHKWGYLQIIHFRIFPKKNHPALGEPHLWKPPYHESPQLLREFQKNYGIQARTVRGAQQLFGNLTGWVREALQLVELRSLGMNHCGTLW